MSTAGHWPSASRYVEAVQDPASVGVAVLREGQVREGLLGMPAAAAGQHAVVFPVDTPTRSLALKCFTTPPDDATRHRYRLVADHVRTVESPLVDVAWHDRGVHVDGRWWPVVTMPWLPGATLDLAVEDRLDDPAALTALADAVADLVEALRRARVAHGDLQHGNVLVEPDGSLHLVDYDGVWVPGAESLVPDEVGHRAFQHPERLRTGAWGPWVDTFSGLVIHLSLLAIAAEPDLWAAHHDGENLVLGPADLADPAASALLAHLRAASDARVAELADVLSRCCVASPASLGSLATLLGRAEGPSPVRPVGLEAPGARPEWVPGEEDAEDGIEDGWAELEVVLEAPPAEGEYDWSPAPPRRRPWRRRR